MASLDFALIRSRLRPADRTTWRAIIDEQIRLMGSPIAIEIQTRGYPEESPVPEISDDEARLATKILNGLETCIAESERLLENDSTIRHIRMNGGVKIVNPHIWILRETLVEDGPERWAMVLGIDINPDFGWHIDSTA